MTRSTDELGAANFEGGLRERVEVPGKASLEGLENHRERHQQEDGTCVFDRVAARENVYLIDTPSPTVSGSLHVGHVFSHTHTDTVARYQCMRGKSVFYPMGWDDNGLPTERYVQNYYGMCCDPSLSYDPDSVPPRSDGGGKPIRYIDQMPTPRRSFIELCWKLTEEDEVQFEALWRYLGPSVNWSQHYQMIEPKVQKIAQAGLLRNLEHGETHQVQAPGL